MPQDKNVQIILSPEFAEAIASRDEALNADRIAAGLPPIQHESPFTTRAQIENEEKNARRREKRARAHDTAAAKAQIAARCQSNPSFERHARKCAICNHPDCDSIESDFVNWRSENTIALNYQLPSRSSVYRHAVAAGLLERRRANLRGVCERIIERVDEAPPSGMAVLRALRIYSQITENGHWVEPPKQSLVTHVHVTEHAATVGAGLSRHDSLSTESAGVSTGTHQPENHDAAAPSSAPPASNCHPACPDEGREPIRASRGWCEGSAVHDEPKNGSAPTATRSVPDLDYIPHWARGIYSDTRTIPTSAQTPSTTAPNPNCENNLDVSPARESLIGTQNASNEKASRGKRGG